MSSRLIVLFACLAADDASGTALSWTGADPQNLAVCQGDCDNNGQCPGDSVCVQRTNGDPAEVEGCTAGDSTDDARKDTDYCSNPPSPAPMGITKCQTGVADLVGDTKAFTVQVCNLFGATCYVNHVETSDCATKALKVENQQCALFPILSYKDHDRADAAKQQVGGPGCSVSCSGTVCKFSGACVSVQCSLGGDTATYAGPAMTKTGSGSSRTVGVKDTSAANAFEVNTFASIDDVSGSKTVLLARTGNYVGTYARGGSASGTNTYNFGKLPTIAGNNYGPLACPSATSLVSAVTATKEMLRMCGNTGKWVYFGAANLLMDKNMYAKYSADSATGLASTTVNINSIAFLSGDSSYKSGEAMDDSRAVYLHDGGSAADMLMTSGTITPAKSTGMPTQDTAGQWRFYTVVFYCDKYDRTDLTACPVENRKMFYVADPNPAPAFGTTAGAIGGTSGGSPSPSPSGSGEDVDFAPQAAPASITVGVALVIMGIFG